LAVLDVTQALVLPAVLKPLHDALRPIENLSAELRDQLRAAVGSTVVELGLDEAAEQELMRAIEVDVADLSQPFVALEAAWTRLRGAIEKAIRAAHPQAFPGAQPRLVELLQQGQLTEAVSLARRSGLRAMNDAEPIAGVIPDPRTSLSTGPGQPAALAANEEGSPRLMVLDRVPTPLLVRHARSLRELRRASLLRTIGLAVLSTVAASLLYGPKFFGTWSEICGLIAFGFTSDFTVGTFVEESIGRLKK
jgi:hypothetical protein